jgi:hypothetical protein
MIFLEDEIITEIRKTRENLLEEYGGIEGYNRRLAAERPRWETEGWRFVSPEDERIRKHNRL